MAPGASVYNTSDDIDLYAQQSCDVGLRFSGRMQLSNVSHLVFSYDAVVVFLSTMESSWYITEMAHAIFRILRSCVPLQIFHRVVEAVAVKVTRFHPLWARSDERPKHDVMDVIRMSFAVAAENSNEVTGRGFWSDGKLPRNPVFAFFRPDAPVARSKVTGELWNWKQFWYDRSHAFGLLTRLSELSCPEHRTRGSSYFTFTP